MQTTARAMYDDRYFYVGVDCRDNDPSKIRTPIVERDHWFGDQDNLAVIIDALWRGKGRARAARQSERRAGRRSGSFSGSLLYSYRLNWQPSCLPATAMIESSINERTI